MKQIMSERIAPIAELNPKLKAKFPKNEGNNSITAYTIPTTTLM